MSVRKVSLADQLAQVPQFEGIVDEVVAGIYSAFSLAIADTFWIGLGATLIAMGVIGVGLRDKPIRSMRDTAVAEAGSEVGRSVGEAVT